MKSKITFEDVQSLCTIIDEQADIISNQNKIIINLHQILAMHGIKILEGEGNEKMKVFDSVVAVIATFFTWMFGTWDAAIAILIVFMVLDYLTGVIVAYQNKTLNSEVGFKGLIKKCMILVVLIIAVMLDRLLNTGTWVFRTLVCYFYIANEGISLLENVSNLGVAIPDKLKDALVQLNKEENQG